MTLMDGVGAPSTSHPESQIMSFGDYLRILRRRKWIIVLAVLVVVGSALGLSLSQTPVYSATATLAIQPIRSPFDQAPAFLDVASVETELHVLESETVKAAMQEKLGTVPPVSVSQLGRTAVIAVTAESTKPNEAALIADQYVETYIEVSRKETIDGLLSASAEIQQRSDALQREIDDLGAKLAGIPPCTGANPPPNCTERESVQRDRDAKVSQQSDFKEKLDQLQVDARLTTGGAKLVSRAAVPTSPIRPRTIQNVSLALAFGLVLGVGLAFLTEFMDDSIKTEEDLLRAAPSLPLTGIIPTVTGWKAKEVPRLVSITEPNSAAAEAYRTLRTSVQFMGIDSPIRRLQVTSPNPGEGKTTIVANLGVALARAGQRVVIVCCDLRRPRVHEFFGLSNEIGFTSVLLGERSLENAVQKVPDVERLYLLASGPHPPNPSELLQSRRAEEVFNTLLTDEAWVLIDSPPILPVSDAMVLSRYVHGTLLVCSSNRTTRKEISRAVELMRSVQASIVGSVLNGVTTERSYGYGHQYYRYAYQAKVPTNGGGNGDGPSKQRRGRSRTAR